MLRKRSVFGLISAGLLAVGLIPAISAGGAKADVLFVSDVSASLAAPASSTGATFSPVATITNSGTLSQPAGSTVTLTVGNGTVSTAPAGCTKTAATAVCSAGALSPGQAQSFTFSVSPNAGATSVTSTVTVKAAILESNVLDQTNNTTSGVTAVAYGVDAGLANQPTTVRFGEDTVLTPTITNTMAPQTVNAVLATGGKVDTRLPLPAGCVSANSGANVNCSFALASGQSRSFDVAVISPASGSSMTSTLTVNGANGGSDTATVTTALFSDAQAFVPAGDSLTFQGSNQFTTFKVPVGSAPGTFLTLRETTLDNVACGTGTCIKQAAEAIFPSSGTYSGNDVNKPFIWDIKYDEKQVCNGLGGGSGCLIDLYWIPTGGTTTQKMPLCSTYGTTQAPKLSDINTPCLSKVVKTKGFSTYTVAVLRDIVIPIISGLSK